MLSFFRHRSDWDNEARVVRRRARLSLTGFLFVCLLAGCNTNSKPAETQLPASPVECVAFGPEGRFLAAGLGGTVKVWDPQSGKEQLSFPAHEMEITCIAISPDGKRLATGSFDKSIRVWNADTGKMECYL